jgi:hypothetical protein
VTPAEFIRARLDEDEVAARAATPGPWRHDPGKEWIGDPKLLEMARRGVQTFAGEEFVGAGARPEVACIAATGPGDDPQSMADAAHIARHDPARALRQVAALRAMVDKDEGAASEYGDGSELSGYGDTGYTVWRAHFTMCTLAAIWSDHPDYDPAWQPTP